jgi:pimeloyl-ACP methyl ester carboxylesterase
MPFSGGGFNEAGVDASPHSVGCRTMRRIAGDGVQLAVRDEGAGRAVLLLHGFPDSSDLWRRQIPALTGAGMRVIAPDLRGFGESEKPPEVGAYRVGRSVADMVALLDALEIERADVVGHDWGAGVAWALAAFVPERVGRLVTLSVGHPALRRTVTIEQRRLSWYMLLFQFEGVAEELLMRDDWKLAREWAATHPDLDERLRAMAEPGALAAGLGWYRANLHPARELDPPRAAPPVQAPTLAVWSDGDAYLTEEQMTRSAQHVAGPWRYERVEGAGHWLQLDAPDRVNALLLEFLA